MQPKESADGLLCDSFQGALFLMYDRFVFQCGAVLGFCPWVSTGLYGSCLPFDSTNQWGKNLETTKLK